LSRFFIRRILLALLQVFIIATIVFSIIHVMPGDPALLALGTERQQDPAAVAEIRHKLGIDRPLIEQYTTWLRNISKFDFGNSLFNNEPIKNYLAQRLPRTLELAIISTIIAVFIGIVSGIIAALRRGSAIDVGVTTLTALGISLPVYVLGTLFILVFCINLKWLPASGFVKFSQDPAGHILRLILPSLTLAFGMSASIARMTRSSLLETLNKEYIQTLRAKGLSKKAVIFKHALRNALIPVITIIGLQFGNLMGGTVLVEYLFNWPGLSTLLVEAVSHRDYPLAQGCIIAIASLFIFSNMIVDLLYGFLDPRVR